VRWAVGWLEGHQAHAFKALEDPAHGRPICGLLELVGNGLASRSELLP
jgi:hypothetical protein